MQRKRLVSRLVPLKDALKGTYHIQEGFNPNYVTNENGLRISRIRVTGTIIDVYMSQDKNYGALVIDDGTQTIRLKLFKEIEPMEGIEKGQIVEVIGKIREYNAERYIMPESITKKDIHFELLRRIEEIEFNKDWMNLVSQVKSLAQQEKSKEEILTEFPTRKDDVESILESISPDKIKDDETPAGKAVFDLLNQLDEGEGVDYQTLMEKCAIPEATFEKVINDFLSDGTCYEPRPGVIKKL